MSANETTQTNGRPGGFLNTIALMVAIVAAVGILYANWSQIKATYYAVPAKQETAPTTDTTELDKVKAQLEKLQAELRAAQNARPVSPPVIVQSVTDGQSPQRITDNVRPTAVPSGDPGNVADPLIAAPAPIIIVHQTSADGTHQTVTGSGACGVGGNVAKRCGR